MTRQGLLNKLVGVVFALALLAPLVAHAAPSGTLYVLDTGTSPKHVAVFQSNHLGNVAPLRTFTDTGWGTDALFDVCLDGSNNIWVVDVTANKLYRYPTSSSGTVSPSVTLTSATTTTPVGCAIDSGGGMWLANDASVAHFSSAQLAAGGTQTPGVKITSASFGNVKAITLDVAQNFFYVGDFNDHVFAFPTNLTSGAYSPTYTFTLLHAIVKVAIDVNDRLYAGGGNNNIYAFNNDHASSSTPDITFGPANVSSSTLGITTDSAANFWIGLDGTNSTTAGLAGWYNSQTSSIPTYNFRISSLPAGTTGSASTITGLVTPFAMRWAASATTYPTATTNVCDNGAGGTTISCNIPAGSTNDVLTMDIYALDPLSSGAITATGWSQWLYGNDSGVGQSSLIGDANTSIDVNGFSDQYVLTANSIAATTTASYSYACVVQTPPWWNNGAGIIAVDGNQNGTADMVDKALRFNPNGQIQFIQGSTNTLYTGATTITSSQTYNDGQVHLVGATYDGTNGRIYVDGNLDGGPTALPSNTNPTTGYYIMSLVKQPSFNYSGPLTFQFCAEWSGTALTAGNMTTLASHLHDGTLMAQVASLSPTSFWKYNQSDASQLVTDSGSAGNNAVLSSYQGFLNARSLVGMGDKEAFFGGSHLQKTGASVLVGSTDTMTTGADFTYEAVVYEQPTYIGGGPILLQGSAPNNGAASTGIQMPLYIDNTSGTVRFSALCNGANQSVFTSITSGAIHLIDAKVASGTMSLQVDAGTAATTACLNPQWTASYYWQIGTGNLSGSYTAAPGDPENGTPIGSANAGAFEGNIGSVQVYNSALSAARITAHFNALGNGTYYNTVGADSPLHWWKLNETSGTTAADSGSSPKNGTYTGFLGESITVLEKVRTAGDTTGSAVSFTLPRSMVAVGAMRDISNAKNVITASHFNAQGFGQGLNSGGGTLMNSTALGVSSSDTGAIALSISGFAISRALTNWYNHAEGGYDNDATGNASAFAGNVPFDSVDTGLNVIVPSPVATPGMSVEYEVPFGSATPAPPSSTGYGFILY